MQNEKQADLLIFRYIARLLAADQYTAAAVVLWGTSLFDARPESVRDIWSAIELHAKVLIQGCGSVGKSYSTCAFILLRWWLDPEFTNIKVISTTKAHASSNTFSTIVKLHRSAIVKMPGIVMSDYIGLDPKERKSGIAVVAVPIGDDGRGRLKGFHPDPRPKPHPKLGPSSCVILFMDECEDAPIGIWEGVGNVLMAKSGVNTVKVIGAYNPKNQASKTAQNAEPEGGWDAFDIERGVQGKNNWTSKNGWFVLRIDGKKTENVRIRRDVYPGFITYEAYREKELMDGGNSIEYFTQARGCHPPEGAVGVIISAKLFGECKGEFLFVGKPVKAAGVDTALAGRDNCVLTLGLIGLATAFQPRDGKLIKFKEPRMALQADQQFALKKGDTKVVGDDIMQTCLRLGVEPENLCIDATGNGSGVLGYLRAVFGDAVMGINFSANATDIKILEEDQYTPEELYDGIVSEVWFALAIWMEFGFIAIAPGIRKDPLESEIVARRCIQGAGKKMRVETKDDYKKRTGGKSPDFADSFTILLSGVRMRGALMGSMLDVEKPPEDSRPPAHSPRDVVEWMEDAGV